MLVLSTKPLQKLTGTDRQTGRQAGRQTSKPMCREAKKMKRDSKMMMTLKKKTTSKIKTIYKIEVIQWGSY